MSIVNCILMKLGWLAFEFLLNRRLAFGLNLVEFGSSIATLRPRNLRIYSFVYQVSIHRVDRMSDKVIFCILIILPLGKWHQMEDLVVFDYLCMSNDSQTRTC